MLKRLGFSLVLVLALPNVAYAVNFPQKVTLVLKQKVSCRDAKRLVRKNRLFVHCTESSPFARDYEAVYLGKEPLTEVLAQVVGYTKVEAAAPYGEITFSGPTE